MKQRKHDSSTTIDTLKCEPKALSKLQTRLRDSLISIEEHEQRKYTVEEMVLFYKVTLNAEPNQLTGSWAVQENLENPGTVIVGNGVHGSSKRGFKESINFSCGVTTKKSKIVPSPETGTVIGKFYKDHDSTVGERVLPWKLISTRDTMHLKNYPRTPLAIRDLETEVASMFPMQEVQDVPPVELLLMRVIFFFLKTAPEIGVPVLISTATPSLHTDTDRYYIEGWKVFEDKPTTFVTWYDLDLGERLAREGRANMMEVSTIALTPVHHMDDTNSDLRGEAIKLLKKILLLNSHRLTQELPPVLRWKTKSFVRARYPFTDYNKLKGEQLLRHGDMEGMFCHLQELYQHVSNSGSSRQQENAVRTSRCVVCNKADDVKRCSRCFRVAYCSKQCQRQDWKSHKKQCQKQ